MKLPNTVYDWLKAIGQIILPATLAFITNVGADIGIQNISVVIKVMSEFIVFWNAIIVIWNWQYIKAQKEAVEIVDYNEEQG